MSFRRSISIALVATLVASPVAVAEGVTSSLTVSEITQGEDGSIIRASVESVSPGSTLEYSVTYQNETPASLEQFAIVGPIPAGAHYLAGSQSISQQSVFEVQIGSDGWAVPPVMREEAGEDGVVRAVKVDPSEYTAVRWRLAAPLAPGASANGAYQVRVNQ